MFDFFKKKSPEVKKEQKKVVEDYNDVMPVAHYFKGETGVTFDKQTAVLKNKVTSFCRHREIESFTKLLSIIETDAKIKQELIDYLTTNETYFYREFKQIQELVNLVKQSNSSSINILCAPSATSEEPYSIAIALLESGVSAGSFKILGIDINADAIQKAKTANYRERNVRNLTPQIRDRYFTKNDDTYSLNNSIKSQVDFKIINIFDASFKSMGKFDFILSRNMLIYFDKETKLKAKNILEGMRKNPNQEIFFGHADLF